MKSDIIEVSTVNKEVYERLRDRIRRGETRPGEKISIRQIAESFGVSTMPVREALRKLQAEGFVIFDRRSILVRELSLLEVKQIFSVRERLETLAIEWAVPNMTCQDLSELKEIVMKMDEIDISHHEWERLNYEFHMQLYEFSGSNPLIQLIKNVWDSVTPYMYIFVSSVRSFKQAQDEHKEFIRLIEEKNINDLLVLAANHLQYTCSVITDALEK